MAFDLASAQPVSVPDEVGRDPNTPPPAEPDTSAAPAAAASPAPFDMASAQKVDAPDEVAFHQPSGKTIGLPPGLNGDESEYLAQTQAVGADKSSYFGLWNMGKFDPATIAFNAVPDEIKSSVGKAAANFVVGTLPKTVGGLAQEAGERGQQNLDTPSTLSNIIMPIGDANDGWVDKAKSDSFNALVQAGKGLNNYVDNFVQKHNLGEPTEAEGPVEKTAYDLTGLAAQTGAAVALTAMTGNPELAAGVFGAITKSDTYTEARAKGLDPNAAGSYSTNQAALQAGLMYVGQSIWQKLGTDVATPLSRFALRMADEFSQGAAQSAGSDIVADQAGVRDTSVGQGIQNAVRAGVLQAAAGAPVAAIHASVEQVGTKSGLAPEQIDAISQYLADNQAGAHIAAADTLKGMTAGVAENPEAEKAAADVFRRFQAGEFDPPAPTQDEGPVITRSPAAPATEEPDAQEPVTPPTPAADDTSKRLQAAHLDQQIDELATQHEANPSEATQNQLDALIKQRDDLGEDVQFKREGANADLGFYSQAARVAEQKLPNTGTGEQHLQNLEAYARNGDIKPEELEYSGVREWLGSQTGKMSKADVANFLRQGGVKLEEVTKGKQSLITTKNEDEPHINEVYRADDPDGQHSGMVGEIIEKNGKFEINIPELPRKSFSTMDEAKAFVEANTDFSTDTKFSKFTLPGGTNYREVLLTLPTSSDVTERKSLAKTGQSRPLTDAEMARYGELKGKTSDQPTFKSSHYEEPNILAHIRLNDRTDADGKKVLFVEEIQSDWHQQGRKGGYKNPDEDKRKIAERENSRADYKNLVDSVKVEFEERLKKAGLSDAERANVMDNQPPIKMAQTIGRGDEFKAAVQRMSDANDYVSKAVPDAPFKKTWQDLALKRILAMAADGGYDKVAWTTGEQQAERYDLSKQIDRIEYRKVGKGKDQKVFVQAVDKNGSVVHGVPHQMQPEQVEDYFGKDIAAKINASKARGQQTLSGVDLKVGGEGMKGFYDNILPRAMEKIVKKWGGRVGETEIDGQAPGTKEDAELLDKLGVKPTGKATAMVHSIELTPGVKEGVSQGLPLFKRGEGEAPADAQRLGRGLAGTDKGEVSANEQDLIDRVTAEIKRLAPFAESKASRQLYATEESGAAGRVEGAAQTLIKGRDLRHILHWSLDSADALGVGRHEAVHALRRAGLFTDSEWQALVDMVHRGGLVDKVSRLYTPEQRVEEAIANKFQDWRRTGGQDASFTGRIFKRISDLLARIAEFSRQVFGKDATAEDVLARIERGDIGSRHQAQRPMDENALPAFLRAGKVITKGRLKLLDGQVRDHDKLIAKTVKEMKAAEDEGRPTVALQKRLSKLDAERDVMDKERGDIMTTERAAETKFLEARTRDEQVEVKGNTIQKLADEENTRGLLAGLREGKALARTDAKAAQEQVISMLEKSGLEANDKAKFIRAIKNIQTPEQLAREMGVLQSRVARLLEQSRARDLKGKIVKALNRTAPTKQNGKAKSKYTADIQEHLDTLRNAARMKPEAAETALGERLGTGEIPTDEARNENRVLAAVSGQSHSIEMSGLFNDIKDLMGEGRSENLAAADAKKEYIHGVVDQAVSALNEMPKVGVSRQAVPGQGGGIADKFGAAFYKAKGMLRSADANLTTLETKMFIADGLKRGVLSKNIVDRLYAARGDEFKMKKDVIGQILDASTEMRKANGKKFDESYDTDLVDPTTGEKMILSKPAILEMALNMGNAGNKDKLLGGYQWSEADVQKVLDTHMTKADWDFVQKTWDTIESLWPRIEELERRTYGVTPPKVARTPVETPYGTYAGGYFPVVYDPARSVRASDLKAQQTDRIHSNFTRPATDKGYTKARTKYQAPILLDLNTGQRELESVIHDVAYREALSDASRILANEDFRAAYVKAFGQENYKNILPRLNAIAKDSTYDAHSASNMDSILRYLRTRTTTAGIGFNPGTVLKHTPTALWGSINELGPYWMASGTKALIEAPKQTMDFIYSRSPFMAERRAELFTEMRDIAERTLTEGKVAKGARVLKQAGMAGVGIGDQASALPTWLGAYNKALHGGAAEADAAATADATVRRAHGSGDIISQPNVQLSELGKLGTMFYSFMNHVYNQQRISGRGIRTADGVGQKAGYAIKGLSYMASIAVVDQLVKYLLGKADSAIPDGASLIEAMAAPIPILRELASFQDKDFEFTPGTRILSVMKQTVGNIAKAADGEDTGNKLLENAIELGSYFANVPLAAPARVYKNITSDN